MTNFVYEEHKHALLLYALEMSYKEIGKKLNIPSENVGVRIFRAKEKVRKLVEKEFPNNEYDK